MYDSAKFDALHNGHLQLSHLRTLYTLSRSLSDVIVKLEYGIDLDEKRRASALICHHLLRKVRPREGDVMCGVA